MNSKLRNLLPRISNSHCVIDGVADNNQLADWISGCTLRELADFYQACDARQRTNFDFVVTRVCSMDSVREISRVTWLSEDMAALYDTVLTRSIRERDALQADNTRLHGMVEELTNDLDQATIQRDGAQRLAAHLEQQVQGLVEALAQAQRTNEALLAKCAKVDALKAALVALVAE